MYEVGRMNVKVDIAGHERRPNVIDKPITLPFVINYIRAQGYDPYVEEKLVKAVQKYPHQALTKFVGTIPTRIAKILAQRKTEEPKFRDLNDAVDPVETKVEDSMEDFEEEYSDPVGENDDYQEFFKEAIQRTEDNF